MLARLGVYQDERGPAALAAGALFALEVAEAFATNAGDALYLARRGAAGLGAQLAASSVLLAVTLGLVGLAVDRAPRDERGRLLGHLAAAAALLLVAARLALVAWPRAAPAGLLILGKQLSAGLELGFWLLVAERFDARQSRRLVPVLLVAGGAGAVLGSLATRAVVALASVEDLLGAAAAACLVAAGLARALVPRTGAARIGPGALAPGPGFSAVLVLGGRATARSELARRLCFVVAAAGAFGPILYTALGAAAAARFSGEAELAGFYGRYRALTNLLTLAAQALLAPLLLRRLGVGAAFLVAPLVGGLAAAGLALAPGLLLAALAQAAARLVDAAMQTPAEKLAQNLLPRAQRGRITGFLDGVAKRSGALLGGLLATVAVAPRLLGVAAGAVAAAWAVTAWVLARRYPELAVEGLAHAAATETPALDEPTARALAAQLAGSDDDRRELAIEVVRRAPAARAAELLTAAAWAARSRPAARARLVLALGRVLEAELPPAPVLADRALALLPLAREALERAAIVQAYARLAPAEPAVLARLEEAPEPGAVRLAAACARRRLAGAPVDLLLDEALALSGAARESAALAILAGRPLDHARRAVAIAELRAEAMRPFRAGPAAALARLAGIGDDDERTLAFGALAEAAGAGAARGEGAAWRAPVVAAATEALEELRTPGPVRAAALAALGALADPAHAPRLARALGDRSDEVRDAAAAGLARLGAAALPVLLVAARFGGRLARDVALAVLRDLEARPSECDDLLDSEREELRATLLGRGALAGLSSPAGRLLVARLGERAGEIRRTLALVLEVRVGDRRVGRAVRGLSAEPRGRARALEALDALLPRALASRVLPALEDGPGLIEGEAPPAPAEALRAELTGGDPLARLLAVHALAPAERAGLAGAIRAAAHAGAAGVDPLRMLQRLHGAEEDEGVPRSVETMLFLKEVELFAELEPSLLAELAAACTWETLAPGDLLEPDGLVVVASGRLGALGPGGSAGAGALFGDPPHPALVAGERTRVLRLGREDFTRAAFDSPAIALAICRVLHRRPA